MHSSTTLTHPSVTHQSLAQPYHGCDGSSGPRCVLTSLLPTNNPHALIYANPPQNRLIGQSSPSAGWFSAPRTAPPLRCPSLRNSGRGFQHQGQRQSRPALFPNVFFSHVAKWILKKEKRKKKECHSNSGGNQAAFKGFLVF